MAQIEWHSAVENAEPLIFRISTPGGSGTGFIFSKSDTTNIVAVATALHVVEHAHIWEEPIRLTHYKTGESFFLKAEDRAILYDYEQDTAAVMFTWDNCQPDVVLPELIEEDNFVKTGVEIGWLGFPAVSQGELCFFSGRVSAAIQNNTAYLVDGVAINGVSGGPTLWLGQNQAKCVGVVSAYIPNRSTGESLPGVAVVQDVRQFHDVISRFRSLDEAKSKEAELATKTEDDSDNRE